MVPPTHRGGADHSLPLQWSTSVASLLALSISVVLLVTAAVWCGCGVCLWLCTHTFSRGRPAFSHMGTWRRFTYWRAASGGKVCVLCAGLVQMSRLRALLLRVCSNSQIKNMWLLCTSEQPNPIALLSARIPPCTPHSTVKSHATHSKVTFPRARRSRPDRSTQTIVQRDPFRFSRSSAPMRAPWNTGAHLSCRRSPPHSCYHKPSLLGVIHTGRPCTDST